MLVHRIKDKMDSQSKRLEWLVKNIQSHVVRDEEVPRNIGSQLLEEIADYIGNIKAYNAEIQINNIYNKGEHNYGI